MSNFARDALFTLDGDTVDAERQAVIGNESEMLNLGMSKPPKVASRPAGGLIGAISAPAGSRAALRSKTYVRKMKKNISRCCVRERF